MPAAAKNTDRTTITVTGRDQSTRKTVPVAVTFPIRTAAILSVYAKAIQERPAYVVAELVNKLRLTPEQTTAVDQLVASGMKP